MRAAELLDELATRDIRLWREGERLKFDAPRGAMDEALRERIRAHKSELLQLLGDGASSTRDLGGCEALSPGQQRIWFHQQLLTTGASYQIPGALRIKGSLDVRRLEAALRQVVRDHDALRCSLHERSGRPMASYAPAEAVSIALRCEDLSAAEALGDQDPDKLLETALHHFYDEPFDLSRAPLLKCRLYRCGDQHHVLALSLHHLVSDGWSVALFVEALVAAYREPEDRIAKGAIPNAPDYRSCLREQAVRLDRKRESLEAFWRGYLEGAPLQFDFPADRLRPPVEDDAGFELERVLDTRIMASVANLARSLETTPFTVLFSAFGALLHRLTGKEDLVIGTAHAGRDDPATHRVMGLFANTVPLRCQPRGELTFRELVAGNREQVLRGFEQAETPFDWIVGALNPPRDLSRPPLYQVMFTFLNQPKGKIVLPGCEISPLPLQNRSSKVDLSLAVEERDGAYSLSVEYKTELYERPRMDALLGQFETLLEAVVACPDVSLNRLRLLNDCEERLLLKDWNDTDEPRDRRLTLSDLLERCQCPDAQRAFCSGDETLSYGQLRAQSLALAEALSARGVKAGDVVAVMLPRGIAYPVAVYGVVQAGAAFLPLAPDTPEERRDFVLGDSGAVLVITQSGEALAGSAAATPEAAFETLAIPREGEAPAPSLPQVSPDHLAYCIYTSGTTGKPKGVEVTHRAILGLLHALRARHGVPAGTTLLGLVPFHFDVSIPDIFMPAFADGEGVILDEEETRSPEGLNARIAVCERPLLQATASNLRLLLGQGWKVPAALRIWCGGETVPPDLAGDLLGRCAQLVNVYGPTEATVWCVTEEIREVSTPLPVGTPLPNYRAYVLDEAGQVLPAGYPGQLYIAGECLAEGYRGRPELTAEKFTWHELPGVGRERLYATGDLARWRFDGRIEVLGRLDGQVKILGHRIETGEIEAILNRAPTVAESAVAAVADASGQDQLAAWVVPVSDPASGTFDEEALRAHLRRSLPPYMEPRWLMALPDLPRSANGKIDRKVLPHPTETIEREGQGLAQDQVAPATPMEKALDPIWNAVLQRDRSGREVSFFDLGGHSLLAVHLLAEVESSVGVRVPVVVFLREPTLAGLARAVEDAGTDSRSTGLDSAEGGIVDLADGAEAPSLFLLPGASGNPHSYAALAHCLVPRWRVRGLMPVEVGGDEASASIEGFASRHLGDPEFADLEQSLILCGHSFGALVAFEMARQRRRAGGEVSALVVLDQPAPGCYQVEAGLPDHALLARIAEAARSFAGVDANEARPDYSGLDARRARQAMLEHLAESEMIPPQADTGLADLLLVRYRQSLEAMQGYRPEAGDVPIVVIRCADPDEKQELPADLGWSALTSAGVLSETVPGSHITMISQAHAPSLAESICSALDHVGALSVVGE